MRRASGRSGFALLSVLWALVILSIIAASLVGSTALSYRMEQNTLRQARGSALADAAISRAILALLDARAGARWRIDGATYEHRFAGARIRVAIQDELGKIDLNAADGSVLTRLLRSAGLDPDEAAALVAKILDWRETGLAHRLNGAKDPEYRAAGYEYGPRNGPFQSVGEVQLVMGMTPELFAKIRPALTVYSGRPLFDPATAPREALLALPDMDAANIEAALSAREDNAASPDGEAATPSSVPPVAALAGRAFTIRAQVNESGVEVTREVVVRLTGKPAQPYWILSRR
jgi:general secretion pathway protein K